MSTGQQTTRDVRIEQALARGRSVEWMARNLGATLADITDAKKRLDAAVVDDPWFILQRAGVA